MSRLILVLSLGLASSSAEDIVGRWWNPERTGQIEIYEKEGRFFGRIISREQVVKDVHNPDPALRNRSVVGLVFLKDFAKTGDNEWSGGTVYSFNNGRTYRGKLWLEDGALMMRGFLGVSLFGKTVRMGPVDDEASMAP
ncbi:MAG: DUF2147 domain-containing protein [Myxococcota bacterium]